MCDQEFELTHVVDREPCPKCREEGTMTVMVIALLADTMKKVMALLLYLRLLR
jgi:hypothetical protein